MRKFVSVGLMVIGIVIFLGSSEDLVLGSWDPSPSHPLAFERKAYGYLGMFVGIAVILLGFMVAAFWPQRIPDRPLPPFEDLPTRAPDE